MKLPMMVYECRSQIFSPIVVGRDQNSDDLGIFYFKVMTCPGGLFSRQLYVVDLYRDGRIQTGKNHLTERPS
jgi:hypothetical protein